MEIFTGMKIDFLGKRYLFAGISIAAILVSVLFLGIKKLNMGVEFRGGTKVILKFPFDPSEDELRSRLVAKNFGDAQIQRYGPAEDWEIMVRVGRTGEGEGDVSGQVMEALRKPEENRRLGEGQIDLNSAGREEVSAWLAGRTGVRIGSMFADEMTAAASAIYLKRQDQGGILTDLSEILDLPGISPAVREELIQGAFVGEFILREVDFIGPSAGKELRVKTLYALSGAMAGILVYIWFRFRFFWGLAAIIALVHDVLITLGVFSITQKDFSLPVVAAILMIIGYSLNDTIVVFDRIRENLRNARVRDLIPLVNRSINQNLSRTIITSLTTLFVVLTLFFFGGEKLNSLSFALIIGVIVGTYSSIFIASPLLLFWEKSSGQKT